MFERILVVEVNWLGDCIMSMPVFKALRQNFPSSYIGVCVVPRLKELFINNPYVDEVIPFNEKTTHKTFKKKFEFTRMLHKKKFDTGVLLHRSFTRALVCKLSGIKNLIGYRRLKTFFIVNKKIAPPKRAIHRRDYYLNLLEKVGVCVNDRYPYFFVSEKASLRAKNFLSQFDDKDLFIAINVSSNWRLKRWPLNNFIELIRRLKNKFNCEIFLTGSGRACSEVAYVKKNLGFDIADICGKTALMELAAILENMDLLISADSGPIHLAAALGTKVLALFGPTSAKITAPWGKGLIKIIQKDVGCEIPCYKLKCADNRCMKEITVNEVFFEAESLLFDNTSSY